MRKCHMPSIYQGLFPLMPTSMLRKFWGFDISPPFIKTANLTYKLKQLLVMILTKNFCI
jgi:hypothetical protein